MIEIAQSRSLTRPFSVANGAERLDEIGRLRRYAYIIPLVGAFLTIVIATLMDVGWQVAEADILLPVLAVPLALGIVLDRTRKVPAVATILLIIGLTIAMSIVGAALALLGTRSPAPIADFWLLGADEVFPWTAVEIVRSSTAWPDWTLRFLRFVYEKTGHFLLITLIALAMSNREARAWRMFVVWSGSMVAVSLLAFSAPALGCFVHLSDADVGHLPGKAGRYAMEAFNNFRFAADPTLSITHVNGVITFPSFHTVCALLIAQAWHGVRWLGLPTKLLTGAIIFSCVPMGGHYLIDLAAGAAVWWAVTWFVRRDGGIRKSTGPITPVVAVAA